MDAVDFHDQVTASPTQPPSFSAADLAEATDTELSRHVTTVMSWVGGVYVPVPATVTLAAQLDDTTLMNEVGLPGAKTIVGLTGPNGAGKSTLCHRWAGEFYRRNIASFTADVHGLPRWQPPHGQAGSKAVVVPVAWINLQADAKIKELDVQLLRFLRLGVSGTARDLSLRAVQALRDHRVRALVIDDVHLLDLSVRGGRGVLDHLKHLNTELGEHGGSLIMIGANLEQTDLISDPQIATRLHLHRLDPYPVTTPDEGAAWKEVVRAVEPLLLPGLPAAGAGVLDGFAKRLHAMTGGYLGELVDILKRAVIIATATRTGTITAGVLDACPRSHRALTVQAHR